MRDRPNCEVRTVSRGTMVGWLPPLPARQPLVKFRITPGIQGFLGEHHLPSPVAAPVPLKAKAPQGEAPQHGLGGVPGATAGKCTVVPLVQNITL
jgi:hypothetical protein